MSENSFAYPLQWPIYRARASHREASNFGRSHTANGAGRDIERSLLLMPALEIVISTNIQLRQDGMIRAGQSAPLDPGAAVYFKYDGKPVVLCCDQWDRVEHNLHAIYLTVEAMRGIDRWGASKLSDTFTGYLSLPAPEQHKPWWEVLDVARLTMPEGIRRAYRDLAKTYHPDGGKGDPDKWLDIQRAYDEAMKEIGL